MSTRWYPIYVKGNPQLRVFLPNFWMKLVKEEKYDMPTNHVKFICSNQMTKYDIKNYLEKIYNVPVAEIRTEIAEGEIKKQREKGYIIKDDDYRVAYVKLLEGHTFAFPNVAPETKQEETEKDMKQLQEAENEYARHVYKHKDRPFVPSWFGL